MELIKGMSRPLVCLKLPAQEPGHAAGNLAYRFLLEVTSEPPPAQGCQPTCCQRGTSWGGREKGGVVE